MIEGGRPARGNSRNDGDRSEGISAATLKTHQALDKAEPEKQLVLNNYIISDIFCLSITFCHADSARPVVTPVVIHVKRSSPAYVLVSCRVNCVPVIFADRCVPSLTMGSTVWIN